MNISLRWESYGRGKHSNLLGPFVNCQEKCSVVNPGKVYCDLIYFAFMVYTLSNYTSLQGALIKREGSILMISSYANSDQLLLILKICFSCVTKTSYLNEEVKCTEPSLSVSVSCWNLSFDQGHDTQHN